MIGTCKNHDSRVHNYRIHYMSLCIILKLSYMMYGSILCVSSKFVRSPLVFSSIEAMFCIVSFVKKTKGKWSHYLGRSAPFEEKWSIFRGDQPTHTHTGLFSRATCPHTHTGLFSRATCPHTLKVAYFQGRPSHAHLLKVVYFQGRPSHTYSQWFIFTGDLPTLTLVYFHGRPAHTYSLWSIFKGDRPFWLGLPEIPSGNLTRNQYAARSTWNPI
jgi:hypothetical protein